MAGDTTKFYVTTPIYYANARPHLGTLYSTVLADVAARIHKLEGQEVFLLTGTDEHGQKIAQAAESVGKTPQQLVDEQVQEFKKLWELYNIQYNCFIRTTDEAHIRGVKLWIEQLIAQGDIYKGVYAGWYCVPCETFVGDKESHQHPVLCSTCSRQTVELGEESYFFRLKD
jgi:methionyl-tRNA synthetase